MLACRLPVHRFSLAIIILILAHSSLAQPVSPPQQVQGLWQLHFDEAPARFQNTVMELMPTETDPNGISVNLYYGNTLRNNDGTGFAPGQFSGTTLEVKGGWYTDPKLFATFDGTEFSGRVEYSEDAIYFFRAERLETKITSVELVRGIGWNDRRRGIDGDIGAPTTEPLHYDDVKEKWDSDPIPNDLPGLSVVLRGENLPLHGNASRKLESSDPKIYSFAEWWLLRDDGSLVAQLKFRADTQPGKKTLFLNGMPIEWELKFTMPEPELTGFYTWKHIDGEATRVQEPILLGARVNFVMAFDGGTGEVAESMEVELSQPGASDGSKQTISLSAPGPGSDARVSGDYLLLPTELEGRWKSLVGDKLVTPLFLEPGQDVFATYEGTTVEAFKLIQPARIDFAFAIDPQEGVSNEAGVPYMRYPFAGGLSSAQRANNERLIMIVGENLPRELDDVFELESYGQPIHYTPYRYQAQDDPGNFDNRRLFDRGWTKLAQITAGFDGAPTRDNSEYLLILATLDESALPGFQQIYLNGDFAPWRLQYGDNVADVRFARDLGSDVFEGSGHLYFTERFAIEILPDIDVGRTDYQLVLRRYRAQATTTPQEYGEPIRLLATRTLNADGRLVYRTPSLDLRPDARASRGRPVTPDVIQLPIEKDTFLTATMTSPELIMTRSAMPGVDAMAEIAVTPDELGALWTDTLRRVGQCYNEIPNHDWRTLSVNEAENQLSINVLYLNDERNDVVDNLPITFGHVAAAVLLRDHFITLMQSAKEHWELVKSDPLRRGEFVNSLLSGRLDYDDPLYISEITNPAGQPTTLIESLMSADVLKERYSINDVELNEWRSSQMEVALQKVIESIDESISYANELGDCSGEELVELTGISFDTVAKDLEPRLVRLSEFQNPQRLEWEPDIVARSWLNQVGSLASNIEEIESRHMSYVQLGLAGVALISGAGAPLVFAETNSVGFVAAEAVSVAADVAAVTLDISSNMERAALLSRSLGSSRVLGSDVYVHASDYGVSDETLMFSVLMAVGGVSASGLTTAALVPDASSQFSNWSGATIKNRQTSSTRALLESLGNKPLSTVGPAGQAAVLEAASISYAKRLSRGSAALDEFDRLPINMFETHVTAQGKNSVGEIMDAWEPLVRPLPADETASTLISYSNNAEFEDVPYGVSSIDDEMPTTVIESRSEVPASDPFGETVIGDPDATLPPPTVADSAPMNQAKSTPISDPDSPASDPFGETVIGDPDATLPPPTVADSGPLNRAKSTPISDPDSPASDPFGETVIGDPDATLPPPTVADSAPMNQAKSAPISDPDSPASDPFGETIIGGPDATPPPPTVADSTPVNQAKSVPISDDAGNFDDVTFRSAETQVSQVDIPLPPGSAQLLADSAAAKRLLQEVGLDEQIAQAAINSLELSSEFPVNEVVARIASGRKVPPAKLMETLDLSADELAATLDAALKSVGNLDPVARAKRVREYLGADLTPPEVYFLAETGREQHFTTAEYRVSVPNPGARTQAFHTSQAREWETINTLQRLGWTREEARGLARHLNDSPDRSALIAVAAKERGVSAEQLVVAGIDRETIARSIDQRIANASPDKRLSAVRQYMGDQTPPAFVIDTELSRWYSRDSGEYAAISSLQETLSRLGKSKAADALEGLSKLQLEPDAHQILARVALLQSAYEPFASVDLAAYAMLYALPEDLCRPETLARIMNVSLLDAEAAFAKTRPLAIRSPQ